MADYSSYSISINDTDYPTKYSGFLTAVQTDMTARIEQGGTLTADLAAGGFKITGLGASSDANDACTVSYANSLLTLGGSPGSVAITDLAKGTATANQLIRVNGAGTGIEGVDEEHTLELLSTATLSSSAAADFTLPAGYFAYILELHAVTPATDSVDFYLRTSTDGGTSYDSGASDYAYSVNNTATNSYSSAATFIRLSAGNIGNAAGEEGWSGTIKINNPSATKKCRVNILGSYLNTIGTLVDVNGAGMRNSSADVDAVRLLMSSGNMASGTIKLYGVRS